MNSEERITQICNQYGIESEILKQGDYLFKLQNFSKESFDAAHQLCATYKPFFIILAQTSDNIILKLIPEQYIIDSLISENDEISRLIAKIQLYFKKKDTISWPLANKTLSFKNTPLIMGILNVTPDSFSDGGQYLNKNHAVDHALLMVDEGVDIIDIGGESTRPGADRVESTVELSRIMPVIEEIRKQSDVILSVDTYKSDVADQALSAGVDIINDISATTFDPEMTHIVEKYKCPIIIMHTKGSPKTMQINPDYNDIMDEVYMFLEEKSEELGLINGGRIIVDPGIGFGKTLDHNLSLIKNLRDFSFINTPLLVGLSRKSFIKGVSGADVEDRLIDSLASEIYSVLNGADMVRVHDIKETFKVKKMLQAIKAA